jgi:hypothetical protein
MGIYKTFSIDIEGISPLIMHSDKLVDPLHPMKKMMSEISCIKNKKDEHHLAMAKIEWEAGLYYDEEYGPYIPSKCLQACIKSAAKKSKKGTATRAILVNDAVGSSLKGFEKETPATLWAKKDKNGKKSHVFSESVVVMRARIMRTRPIFHTWSINFEVTIDTSEFDVKDFRNILDYAGNYSGLCELRPEKAGGSYGRFKITNFEEV